MLILSACTTSNLKDNETITVVDNSPPTMASLFYNVGGLVTPCFEDAQYADKVFDITNYENSSLVIVAKVESINVGNTDIWNIQVEPLIIKPQQKMNVTRGFHLPASNPLDFRVSAIDITFVDGSVFNIPAANCISTLISLSKDY